MDDAGWGHIWCCFELHCLLLAAGPDALARALRRQPLRQVVRMVVDLVSV